MSWRGGLDRSATVCAVCRLPYERSLLGLIIASMADPGIIRSARPPAETTANLERPDKTRPIQCGLLLIDRATRHRGRLIDAEAWL